MKQFYTKLDEALNGEPAGMVPEEPMSQFGDDQAGYQQWDAWWSNLTPDKISLAKSTLRVDSDTHNVGNTSYDPRGHDVAEGFVDGTLLYKVSPEFEKEFRYMYGVEKELISSFEAFLAKDVSRALGAGVRITKWDVTQPSAGLLEFTPVAGDIHGQEFYPPD